MSFWDKIKKAFGGGGNDGGDGGDDLPGHDPALVRAVSAIIASRCEQLAKFEAVDIADVVTQDIPGRSVAQIREACAVVEALFTAGRLASFNYTRTGNIYHPLGQPPTQSSPPKSGAVWPAPTTTGSRPPSGAPPAQVPVPVSRSAPPVAPPAPAAPIAPAIATPPAAPDPLDAPDILALSPEEFRKRALKIKPYSTAWIGRVDTIPPQSDERTALIDRGLILRGKLTPAQITEIHRIGDMWLRHHEAVKLAEIDAQRTVEAWLQSKRDANAARKAEKKAESAVRHSARAEAVRHRRAEDIVFLGRGVSGGLADRRAHIEELGRRGLPLLASPADVAKALGLTVSRLRWLCFHAEAPTRTHYVYFEVPKKSGGMRLLAAPHDDLKAAQHWVLENILSKLPVTDSAHGFHPGRSTVTNAQQHVGRDVVVNCDLSDFFPSITFPRVRGVFEAVGYSPAAATVLALLCTESPRARVVNDGVTHWVAVSQRALPQGAPTSPALSNQVARKLDQRLRGVCNKLGWAYTRYADDLTFSAGPDRSGAEGETKKGQRDQRDQIGWLLARVHHLSRDEGFRLNSQKTRVQRAARRQEVTGIVVNDKTGVPREDVRRLRAILHGAKKTGLAAQNRANVAHFEAWLRGSIAYVSMVDREKGAKLLADLNALPPGP